MSLEINVEREAAAVVVVTPDGEVDLNVSSELQQSLRAVLADRPSRIIIDLGHVPYMDSSGVATLIDAMQFARRQDAALVLCRLQDKVRSIFEITHLDRVFTIVPSREEALLA